MFRYICIYLNNLDEIIGYTIEEVVDEYTHELTGFYRTLDEAQAVLRNKIEEIDPLHFREDYYGFDFFLFSIRPIYNR